MTTRTLDRCILALLCAIAALALWTAYDNGQHASCLPAATVNALFERDMRGELTLSDAEVARLKASECSALSPTTAVVLADSPFWTLNAYNGDGTRIEIPILCDEPSRTCEFAVPSDLPSVVTPTATVYLPTVVKPSPQPTQAPPTAVPTSGPSGGRVRVNYASQEELEALPAIGATIATRIIAARPILSCEDGDARVKGWGVNVNEQACPLMDFAP